VLDPALDLGLVPFHRAALWLLGAPTEVAQETSHMVDVVGYSEAIADDLRDAGTSPQICRKPRHLGTLEQNLLETLSGPGIQLEGAARSGFGPQASLTGFPVQAVPAPNAAPINPNPARYFDGLKALQQKPDGTDAPSFQFLWASRRSHVLSPAQSIGH
jgi:hypothetical protein